MNTKEEVDNPLHVLIGEQLSSVIFVQDYLQLDFDGNRLTCFAWPEVISRDSTSMFGELSYRNNLCSLIARKVSKVVFLEEIILEIEFENESKVRLSLNPELKNSSGEIGTFTDTKNNWSFF